MIAVLHLPCNSVLYSFILILHVLLNIRVPYSICVLNTFLTSVWYACDFNCWLSICKFPLKIPRALLALLVMVLMYSSHVSLLLNVTPKCFALVTLYSFVDLECIQM